MLNLRLITILALVGGMFSACVSTPRKRGKAQVPADASDRKDAAQPQKSN